MSVSRPSWVTKFLAVVRYEMFWNIRKKKFLGMLIIAFAISTLWLAASHIVNFFGGPPVEPNPDYVISTNVGLGGFAFFLFAIVTVMNTISAEFESGTIVPLLAKPVSRTTVFLGKLFAAFLTLLATYCILMIYMAIGGFVVYGPQNNLHLVPLSSLIAALGPLGVWLGTTIIGQIIAVLAGQGWILTYIPGTGTAVYVGGDPPPLGEGVAVATGTDSIGSNLINYILHPSWEVTHYKMNIGGPGQVEWEPLYSEPFSNVILTSIAVAIVYFIVFIGISWYVFRRAQITE